MPREMEDCMTVLGSGKRAVGSHLQVRTVVAGDGHGLPVEETQVIGVGKQLHDLGGQTLSIPRKKEEAHSSSDRS